MFHVRKFQNIPFRKMQGGIGIPAIRWAGSEGDYNVLVSVSIHTKEFRLKFSRKCNLSRRL